MRYLILLACLLTPFAADAVWFDSSWSHRVPIEIIPSKVGTTSAVTNIPVYVSLADMPAGFWSTVKSDGGDIRLVESDETTETAFELVSISTASSTGELHFLADSLSTTSTSTFYVYYGNAGASAYANTGTYGRNAVWTNYMMVHHFDMSSGTSTDSTGNGNDATAINSPTYQAAGKLGYAVTMSDTGDRHFRITASSSTNISTTGYTIDMWLSLGSTQPSWFAVLNRGDGSNNDWSVQRNSGSGDWREYHTNTHSTTHPGELTPFLNTGYQKLTVVFDTAPIPDRNSLYHNGNFRHFGDMNGIPTNTAGRNTYIGTDRSATLTMNGSMDELRVANVTRDAAFIWTEFNNQSTTTEFYAIGAPETDPGGGGGGGGTATTTVMVYDQPGSYNWTAPTSTVFVQCWGAGGGGGDGQNDGAGGGGGGAYAEATTTVTIGNTYTITIGQGGNGATGNNSAGSDGGNSSFATTSVVAEGGKGGGTATGGSGGLAANSIGSTTYNGGTGGNSDTTADSGGGGGGSAGPAGAGGNGVTGSGGGSGSGGAGGTGNNGAGGAGGIGVNGSYTTASNGTTASTSGGGGGGGGDNGTRGGDGGFPGGGGGGAEINATTGFGDGGNGQCILTYEASAGGGGGGSAPAQDIVWFMFTLPLLSRKRGVIEL